MTVDRLLESAERDADWAANCTDPAAATRYATESIACSLLAIAYILRDK